MIELDSEEIEDDLLFHAAVVQACFCRRVWLRLHAGKSTRHEG